MPTVTDNFPTTGSTLGANWTVTTGSSCRVVAAAQAKGPSFGTGANYYSGAGAFGNDHQATVTPVWGSGATGANDYVQAMVRCSSSGNGYALRITKTGSGTYTARLWRMDAGSSTSLNVATSISIAEGTDTFTLGVVGTTLTGYQNGVAISGQSFTDTTYATGYPGMQISDASTNTILISAFTATDGGGGGGGSSDAPVAPIVGLLKRSRSTLRRM